MLLTATGSQQASVLAGPLGAHLIHTSTPGQ